MAVVELKSSLYSSTGSSLELVDGRRMCESVDFEFARPRKADLE